jgi:hypothetical protein
MPIGISLTSGVLTYPCVSSITTIVEETQMIVDEASWEDQRGLERVLLQIFGRAGQ